MNRVATLALLLTVALLTALAAAPVYGGGGDGGPSEGQVIPGQYIVLVGGEHDPVEVASEHDIPARHVYRTAVNGFAATTSPQQVNDLQEDQRVLVVEPERIHTLADQPPTGVDRIEVDQNPTVTTDGTGKTVELDVAIIDTGIQPDHGDLNVAGGRNFAGGNASNWQDKNGHGTHVAGTVGAIDNGTGVIGVAPGARLWALRVCARFCFSGDIIAAIDWAAEKKQTGEIDFAAANFSISSADSTNECDDPANATHTAICNLVNTGVVFVMAAGNDDREKQPYPVAFAVSAIADFDGMGGAAGSSTCREDVDETLANFSNYGSAVDIAAPGVCILSTWNDGGYNTISGTSMATPHVTGAVALYLHANGLTPATDRAGADTIKNAIIDAALPQGTANHYCSYDDSKTGGRLLFVNGAAFGGDGNCDVASSNTPPSVSITNPGDGTTVSGTVTVTADAWDDGSLAQVEFFVDGSSIGTDTDGSNGWSVSWDTTAKSEGGHTVSATATDDEGATGSDSISVTVDNADEPPGVAVTNPSDGATVSGTVAVTADASDDRGVSQVEFFVDGSSIGVDTDGSDGWSASWDTTTNSEGGHTVSATATDTAGQTASDSVSVTVDNSGGTATVPSISYELYGGRGSDKHLDVTVAVVDGQGSPVSGASVSIKLDNTTTGGSWAGTATTDDTGNVVFSLKNASSGCYETTVTDVQADGLTWDGKTPANGACK